MRKYFVFALCAFACTVCAAGDGEFVCPSGAKDSGYEPGYIVRWCEVGPKERPRYHGPVWRWHRNGQLAAKENYVNGNGEGEWRTWFDNGTPAATGSFIDGMKMGLWKYWNANGGLKTEVDYGESRNRRTEYDTGGNKRAVGDFHQDGKLGLWIWWSADGTEKARCDFGDGVLKVSTAGCKAIAEELEPKGFSKPITKPREIAAGVILITVGTEQFKLTVPRNWKADLIAAAKEKTPLVVIPENGKWRGDGPNIYFRTLFRDGRSFKAIADETLRGIEEDVPNFKQRAKGSAKTVQGRDVATRTIQYNGSFGTDSPFTIVTKNQIFERIAVVDVSPYFAVMAVVTAPEESMLKAAENPFMAMLKSIHIVQ